MRLETYNKRRDRKSKWRKTVVTKLACSSYAKREVHSVGNYPNNVITHSSARGFVGSEQRKQVREYRRIFTSVTCMYLAVICISL